MRQLNLKGEELLYLVDSCTELICIAGADGYFKAVNTAFTTTLGYSREELLSKPFIEFVHPDDVAATIEETKALATDLHQSVFFQNRYRKADGSYICLAWGSQAKDGKIFAIAKDITELKSKEAYLSEIQKHAQIGGWTLNVDDFSTSWTDETYHIHEVPVGTPTNTEEGISFFHPEYQDKIRQCVMECIDRKKSFDDEFKFITAKGRHIWVRATGNAVTDNDGKITHLIGTFQDIQKHKTISNQLEETAAQLADVLENSPGMVYQFKRETDGYMHFPYVSPQAFEIYEVTAEDFKKDPSIMLTMAHDDDKDELIRKIEYSAHTLNSFEWFGRIISATKQVKWIRARSHPRKLEDGSILWNGIVVDITREKGLEERLSQQRQIAEHSARLASIGELAAGVGHEINNPLAIVMGLLNKTLRLLDEEEVSKEDLRSTIRKQQDACNRIQKIVSGLRGLAFAGSDAADAVANINECVLQTTALISEMYKKDGITVSNLNFCAEMDCYVSCSPTHVNQILMNLLSNARDAVSTMKNAQITVSTKAFDGFLRLSVQDNGRGIESNARDKVFQSFFSTKEVGKGTGLGLALCKSIVEARGGAISFESTGSGTTFIVEFPKAKKPRDNIQVQLNSTVDNAGLRALIVDDEEGIREVLSEYLQLFKCKSTVVSSGHEAIKAVKQEQFDLIVTDLKMPGMDGLTLLSELAHANLATNALKVVITGGVLKVTANDLQTGLIDSVLPKPFSQQEIASVVEKANRRRNALIKGT